MPANTDSIPSVAIDVRPFRPEDQDAVKALILAGLEEHWGSLDQSMNRDLDDIAQTYDHGLFLVACHGERIVGTGAIVPLSPAGAHHACPPTAQVVRMSVAVEVRRHGIGRRILHELCDRARALGVRRLVLETTSTWHEVIAFYESFGFRVTHTEGGDTYFQMQL
jgi:putative acetyltransferase